jgi:ADP-ribosylglycohydrolase
MLGAIAGDIIGSTHEFNPTKSEKFTLFAQGSDFTDDTVLTVAVTDCILHKKDYATTIKEYGRRYSGRGYGGNFRRWLKSADNSPYNSFGNGSAMRVSPVGFAFSSVEEVLEEARRSATVTHNHPEGIKGARVVAASIFLARQKHGKDQIRGYIESQFGYDLHHTIDEIRPGVTFDETCQGSVPQAILAFLDSASYEDALRKAISLGADADTQACIAGGIAQAFYQIIPPNIIDNTRRILDPDLLKIVDEFNREYSVAF